MEDRLQTGHMLAILELSALRCFASLAGKYILDFSQRVIRTPAMPIDCLVHHKKDRTGQQVLYLAPYSRYEE